MCRFLYFDSGNHSRSDFVLVRLRVKSIRVSGVQIRFTTTVLVSIKWNDDIDAQCIYLHVLPDYDHRGNTAKTHVGPASRARLWSFVAGMCKMPSLCRERIRSERTHTCFYIFVSLTLTVLFVFLTCFGRYTGPRVTSLMSFLCVPVWHQCRSGTVSRVNTANVKMSKNIFIYYPSVA